MNSHRPDVSKHLWPISPTFRTGPRQAGYDQNAEEIIRFVRHIQRPDLQQHGAPRVNRRPVLPAIGGYYKYMDVNSFADNIHCPLDSFRSEPSQSGDENHMEPATGETTCSNDEHREKGLAAIDSYNQVDRNSLEDGYNNNNAELLETVTIQKVKENKYISNSQESVSDVAPNKSIICDESLHASKSTKPCSNLNKFKVAIGSTQAPIIDSSKPLANYSKPPDIGQLRQLQPLPQLPPIWICGLPSRPSAPSPSPMSPTPMSGSDNDYFSDEDRGQYEI